MLKNWRKYLTISRPGSGRRIKETTLFGRPFRIDDLDSLSLASGGEFEKPELEFVENRVKPGDVCVDIGANIGLFTVALARAAGRGGRVYSFEPDPDNFAILEHNASAWRDVCDISVHRSACGDRNSAATLYKSEENRGMHRLYESVCCRGEGVAVTTVIADEIVRHPVNFVKIDIEGYEPYAIRGLTATIRQSPDIALLSEFSPMSMMEAGSSATAYVAMLAELGLLPHRITADGLQAVEVNGLLGNCARLESGDFSSFRTRCNGLDSAGVFDMATQYAEGLGFDGPIIENLVFVRASSGNRP